MKILVGYDNSPHAQAAVRWAIEIALRRDHSVTLMHVAHRPSFMTEEYLAKESLLAGKSIRTLYGEVEREIIADAEGFLDEQAKALKREEIPVEVKVAVGDPGHELADESGKYDLVIVGKRGHGRILSLLLGSTSTKVINHSKCAVLVAE